MIASLALVVGSSGHAQANAQPSPAVSSVAGFIWPASGTIYQNAAEHKASFENQYAEDIGNGGSNVSVIAAYDGTVSASFLNLPGGTCTVDGKTYPAGYGNVVVIRHDQGSTTYFTLYGHLSSRSVLVGDQVAQGQQIGVMGSTGCATGQHVHFEIGTAVNGQGLITPASSLWNATDPADGTHVTQGTATGGSYPGLGGGGHPSPQIALAPVSGVPGQPIHLDGSSSGAGSGSITSYAWSFGDGASGSGAAVDHTYNTAGDFTVTLTVTNSFGFSAGATAGVRIEDPHTVSGDFNHDGYADALAFYDYGGDGVRAWLFKGKASGLAAPVSVWSSGAGKWHWTNFRVVAGDFNHDGYADALAFYDYGGDGVRAWLFKGKASGLAAPVSVWSSGAGKWHWANF